MHAGVILALGRLVAAPLSMRGKRTASATTLGAWFPSFDEASPLARFLGAHRPVHVWWVVVLAIGVAVLYGTAGAHVRRRDRLCYVGIALVLAGDRWRPAA